MKSINSTGFIVPASILSRLLLADKQRPYELLIAEHDWDGAKNYLAEHLPDSYPMPDDIFLMADDADFDDEDLQRGTMYASFAESDLFKRTPTRGMSCLTAYGIEPTLKRWVDFG